MCWRERLCWRHGPAGVIVSAAQCGTEQHGGDAEDSQQGGIRVMTGESQLVVVHRDARERRRAGIPRRPRGLPSGPRFFWRWILVRAQERMPAWEASDCGSPTVLHTAGSDGFEVLPRPCRCKRRMPAAPRGNAARTPLLRHPAGGVFIGRVRFGRACPDGSRRVARVVYRPRACGPSPSPDDERPPPSNHSARAINTGPHGIRCGAITAVDGRWIHRSDLLVDRAALVSRSGHRCVPKVP